MTVYENMAKPIILIPIVFANVTQNLFYSHAKALTQ